MVHEVKRRIRCVRRDWIRSAEPRNGTGWYQLSREWDGMSTSDLGRTLRFIVAIILMYPS